MASRGGAQVKNYLNMILGGSILCKNTLKNIFVMRLPESYLVHYLAPWIQY